MLENYEHIAYLITGFNQGTLSETEHDELDEWLTSSDANQLLFEDLTDPEKFREYLRQMQTYDEEGSWDKIKDQKNLRLTPIRTLFLWKRIAAAASILLVIGLGSYFTFFNRSSQIPIAKTTIPQDVKAPVTNKAMITLADGRKVSIDSITAGMLAKQSSVTVTKTDDGKIVYSGNTNEVVYNTLINPKGSKVQDMTLADGSHVWLNAGSSIIYPIAFIGNERKVTMTGEAYFSVKHNEKMPFAVSVNGMEVHDLGTEFNINAYDDESVIKTTLVSGSADVNGTILKPGQQAQLNNGQIKLIENADVQQAIAWKLGYFQFSNTNIESIMRQISRWYNVDVVYEKKTNQGFNGSVPTSVNVSDIFKMLEATGWVHFQIEGNRVTVRE